EERRASKTREQGSLASWPKGNSIPSSVESTFATRLPVGVDVHTPKANVQYATLDRKPLKSVRNRHQTNTILNTSHEPKSTTVLELKYRSYEMFTIIQEFTEKYRGFRGSLFSIHPLSGCERLPSFIRLIRCDNKEQALRSSVLETNRSSPDQYSYLCRVRTLSSLPGSPIAYWISGKLLNRLRTIPSFEGSSGTVKQGIATADEFRFARAWWETGAVSRRWMPYSKT